MIDTIPVRSGEHFPVERVREFLRTSTGLRDFDLDGLRVEQFAAGQSNLTYLLRSGTWEAVLRRPPLGPVAPRAHDMAREFRILERLHPMFPLAPQPYALCQDPTVIGATFYIMERRRGLVLDQQLPPGWQPSAALHHAIGDTVSRVLAELHAVDWQAAGLGEIGRPDGYMRRQVSGWIDRYQRVRTDEIAGLYQLQSWFSANMPESPPATIVHNDYKLNNVLMDAASPAQMTAVLDWEMATVGDPLSDLAGLLVYWIPPDEIDLMGGLRSVSVEPGFPTREEMIELYARHSRRDVADLRFYMAFAYFKLGVILQQIYFRWREGQTQDDRFAQHDQVATNLIARAIEIAGV